MGLAADRRRTGTASIGWCSTRPQVCWWFGVCWKGFLCLHCPSSIYLHKIQGIYRDGDEEKAGEARLPATAL